MDSFIETRFPDDIAYGSTGGPEFSTNIAMTQNGYEQRNINWSDARAQYNVSHGIKNEEQLRELLSFFRARFGRAIGFRFKDWTDYIIKNQIIAIADGQGREFQINKIYNSGSSSYTRIITKIVTSTLFVSINDIAQEGAYTIDLNSGILLFDNPPASSAEIVISCEFDVPVRFDTDQLSASIDGYGTNSWRNIRLIEIKDI